MLEVILEDLKNQKEVRKNLIQMKELLKDEETRKELSELSAEVDDIYMIDIMRGGMKNGDVCLR